MADPPIALYFPAHLRALTQARIGLGRTGQSLDTTAMLDFELAHARARDAVHADLDVEQFRAMLGDRELIEVRSQAADRAVYLKRPDLGRRLDETDAALLAPGGAELAIVIGDGLSATAVASHGAPLVAVLTDRLASWSIAPLVLARQARVALGDTIGAALRVDLLVMLIGERPGLSAPDSLGAYITWAPRPGRRDSERNCVSNIRPPHGLGYEAAAEQICWLLTQARSRRLTGVDLKDDRQSILPPARGDTG